MNKSRRSEVSYITVNAGILVSGLSLRARPITNSQQHPVCKVVQ